MSIPEEVPPGVCHPGVFPGDPWKGPEFVEDRPVGGRPSPEPRGRQPAPAMTAIKG